MSKTAAQRDRELRECPFCRTRSSSPTGEEVPPRAVRRKVFPGDDWYFSPLTGRWQKQFDPVKVDCCVSCNGKIESRFEDKGQDAAVRLLKDSQAVVTEREFRHVAAWFLKTWLLLKHPNAEFQDSTPQPDPWPVRLFDWLAEPSAPPPSALYMWIYGFPLEGLGQTDQTQGLMLPPGAKSFEWSYARIKGIVVFSPHYEVDVEVPLRAGLTQIAPYVPRQSIKQFDFEPVAWLNN